MMSRTMPPKSLTPDATGDMSLGLVPLPGADEKKACRKQQKDDPPVFPQRDDSGLSQEEDDTKRNQYCGSHPMVVAGARSGLRTRLHFGVLLSLGHCWLLSDGHTLSSDCSEVSADAHGAHKPVRGGEDVRFSGSEC